MSLRHAVVAFLVSGAFGASMLHAGQIVASGLLPSGYEGPPVPVAPATITRDTEGRVTARAVRLDTPLRIDGQLDEAIYASVLPMSDLLQIEPHGGQPASQRTEIWVFFDRDNVYVSRPGQAQIWSFNVMRKIFWKNEVAFPTRIPPEKGPGLGSAGAIQPAAEEEPDHSQVLVYRVGHVHPEREGPAIWKSALGVSGGRLTLLPRMSVEPTASVNRVDLADLLSVGARPPQPREHRGADHGRARPAAPGRNEAIALFQWCVLYSRGSPWG